MNQQKIRAVIILSSIVALVVALIVVSWLVFQPATQPVVTDVRSYLRLPTNELVIDFFDIGQGDGALIRLPNGDDVVVDGGPDATIVKKLGATLPLYDHTIEYVILSHSHTDHLVGLVELLDRYKVEVVIMPEAEAHSAEYDAWMNKLQEKNIETKFITSTSTFELAPNVVIDMLWPAQSFENKKVENLNNTSIVFKLTYGSSTALFTGDYEDEEMLVSLGGQLDVDLLKVGHHGSSNANDDAYINVVKPEYAVISCGQDNSFKHPHYRTLYNLERVNAKVLRTDLLGDIRFISTGNEWQLK